MLENPYEASAVERSPTQSRSASFLLALVMFLAGALFGSIVGYEICVYEYYTGPKIMRVQQ
jgi:hypothetical protein